MSLTKSAIAGAWRADAASYSIDVTANSVSETVTVSVTSGREYWLVGDSEADSSAGDGDLLALVDAAVQGHSELTTVTCTLVDGRVRLTGDIALSIEWSTSSAVLAEVLGWSTADTASATTLDATSCTPYVWIPDAEISDDTRDRQVLVRGSRTSLSGLVYTSSWGDAAKRRELSFEQVRQERILEEYAGSTYTAFETINRLSISLGRRLRVYEDATDLSTGGGYSVYRASSDVEPRRNAQWAVRWDVPMELRVAALTGL